MVGALRRGLRWLGVVLATPSRPCTLWCCLWPGGDGLQNSLLGSNGLSVPLAASTVRALSVSESESKIVGAGEGGLAGGMVPAQSGVPSAGAVSIRTGSFATAGAATLLLRAEGADLVRIRSRLYTGTGAAGCGFGSSPATPACTQATGFGVVLATPASRLAPLRLSQRTAGEGKKPCMAL